MSDDWRSLNRRNWNERVPLHVASKAYDVEGFRAGTSSLSPQQIDDVGSVEGKSLVHLQCHFGLDTLSWARLGARVTGLDFSEPAIQAARQLASDINVEARFVCADVYGAAEALNETYDIVYTGLGAINWLPDIQGWARVVADLLKPGGELYLLEYHPFTWVFADDDLAVAYDYFTPNGLHLDDASTYTDADRMLSETQTVEWNHNIGDVVSAVLNAGLNLTLLREENRSYLYQRWPFLVAAADRHYDTPADHPSLPLMYTLGASKPV
ncbi:MAG: class I SAM-dependent methyltransferase [Alphaproteobacteria bacterium]